jgi:predicted ATP-dependent endonuclease of OLD family
MAVILYLPPQPIQNYLNALNGFFSGSNKKVSFDKVDNGLYFEAIDDPENTKRSLLTFSSGEKQLFILLTYLAFISDESGLLMIDEPELSLHPAWQKRFVKALESIRPNDCQVVLATHSPEIAGAKRDRAIVLKVAN